MRRLRKAVWLAAVAVVLAFFLLPGESLPSSVADARETVLRKVGIRGPEIDTRTLERLIHERTNEQRPQRQLSTLAYDEDLVIIARGHSRDMAETDFFAHTNPRGQDATDRARAVGYGCRKDYGSYYTDGVAENIFQAWLYSSAVEVGYQTIKNWTTQAELAVNIVDGWMESPGHRQNILEETYDREGIGLSITRDDKVFVTQNFC